MERETHEPETRPATNVDDPLTDLPRRGARDLLRQAVEAELQTVLDDTADRRLPDGTKEFVAIDDGVRESTQNWYELLVHLRDRHGLTIAPQLAIGDGALGFWNAVSQVYPPTRHQRCRVHKTANVLNKLPKKAQPKAKSVRQAIWVADTRTGLAVVGRHSGPRRRSAR